LRSALVIAQLSLAVVLLISAGLMIQTVRALATVEPGFTNPEQLLTLEISVPPVVAEAQRVTRIEHDMLEKLAAIPGVASAAFADVMPMDEVTRDWDAIGVEGAARPGEIPPLRLLKYVSPGFFRTLGTRLVAGRDYTWTDLYSVRPVAIVSENLARELWGSPTAALGKRIGSGLPGTKWREVIGVVQDVRENGLQERAPAIVYWPAMMESLYRPGRVNADRTITVAIRSERAETASLLEDARTAIWSVEANAPLAAVRTMRQIAGRSMARTSFTLVMLTVAAAMALVLGIVGIYGIISYAVSQRTREIGIRLALGARPRDMKRMIVGQGLILAAVGVALGLAAAVAATRLMSSLLFGISPLDPTTFAVVPLLLAAAAAAASYLPARRAAAVDPSIALNAD
jgi:predicted permease